jgi:biotin carboxylase
MAEVLHGLQREARIAGILSSSDYFVESAARLAAEHSLPGEDPSAIATCRNKAAQRQRLQEAGLRTPQFACVHSVQEAMAALEKLGLPLVVKPTVGSGSVGVRLCCSPAQVAEHAGALLARKVNERGMPLPAELLLEEYLIGPEFSVETLGQSVLGITRKHVSQEPFFVELGHDFPAGVSRELAESMIEVAQEGLRALGVAWGPAHVELRLTESGPTIIEINPRLAGGFIPEIVRLAFGVDPVRETMKLVVGQPADILPVHNECSSIRFLTPSRDGVISAITGLNEAARVDGVVDVQTYRRVGDRVGIENDFRDRIGHVISCAGKEVQAASLSELARSKINIEVMAN